MSRPTLAQFPEVSAVLTILAVTGIIGFGLILLGWRGRLINNRPWCRYCKFDLTGLAETTTECPECGSVLAKKGTVRRGQRARHLPTMSAGVILLVLGTGLGAFGMWSRANGYQWVSSAPSSWLVAQARGGSGEAATSAITELVTRMDAGKLKQTHATLLIERALAEQADPMGDWFGGWDGVFESAFNAGLVSDAQLTEFALNFWQVEMLHQDKMRPGAPWVGEVFVSSMRGMPTTSLRTRLTLQRVTVGDTVSFETSPMSQADFVRSSATRSARAKADWSYRIEEMLPMNLGPGEHQVLTRFQVWIADGSVTPTRTVSTTFTQESKIEIVEPDRELIALVVDENLRGALQRSISPRNARITIDPDTRHTWSAISIRDIPIPIAFEVYWKLPGEEIHVGHIVGKPGEPGGNRALQYGGWEYLLPEFDLDSLDIILRPSAEIAEMWLADDSGKIWGEEIIFTDVPVEYDDRRPEAAEPGG